MNDRTADAEHLRAVIRDNLDTEKQTPYILDKMIERIEEGHAEMVTVKNNMRILLLRWARII